MPPILGNCGVSALQSPSTGPQKAVFEVSSRPSNHQELWMTSRAAYAAVADGHLDDFSRAVAGYAVNLGAPSALQTALALRQAIWRNADPAWTVCSS